METLFEILTIVATALTWIPNAIYKFSLYDRSRDLVFLITLHVPGLLRRPLRRPIPTSTKPGFTSTHVVTDRAFWTLSKKKSRSRAHQFLKNTKQVHFAGSKPVNPRKKCPPSVGVIGFASGPSPNLTLRMIRMQNFSLSAKENRH